MLFLFYCSLTTFPVIITEAVGLQNSGVWSKREAGSWRVELYILGTGFSKQRDDRVLDRPQNLLKVSSSPLEVSVLTEI